MMGFGLRFVLLLWWLPLLGHPEAPSGAPRQAPAPQAQSGARELLRLEENLDAMGSVYSVTLYGYEQERMEAAMEAAFNEIGRLDRMMSNYRPESELSEVNRYAAQKPVRVTPEFFDLLAKCRQYSRGSDGAFDITVGPLMKVWGFYRGTGKLPAKDEVARSLEKVGYRHVILDKENHTVRFDEPGVELDPGGIGKGYAVDRVVDILRENGLASALVSAGGSSIYGLGAPAGNAEGWEVKIRDPKHPRQTIQDLRLKNESMSTSGNYEKFFVAEGKLYSHIMDPRTGFPAEGVLSVSVIAPTTLESEAWTKPYYILGRRWAVQHRPPEFRVFLCEDKAEQPCAWLQ